MQSSGRGRTEPDGEKETGGKKRGQRLGLNGHPRPRRLAASSRLLNLVHNLQSVLHVYKSQVNFTTHTYVNGVFGRTSVKGFHPRIDGVLDTACRIRQLITHLILWKQKLRSEHETIVAAGIHRHLGKKVDIKKGKQ